MTPTTRLSCLVLVAVLAGAAAAQQVENYPTRSPAPPLEGSGDWLNTAGPISLRDLRGKFVILDFWTYCCINCMHILPELKKLEHEHPKNLVVIGVHSAKFYNERDSQNVREAIERYEIEHPVVCDPQLVLWRKYQVDMWPSLRIIDPEGQLVAHHEREFTADTINRWLKPAIANHRRKGTLDETPLSFSAALPKPADTPLRFPGKVLADAAGSRLFIADSGHNRIVITKLNGELIDVIGTGQIGKENGSYDQASFDHPQGLALKDDSLFVADTENHLIRKVSLKARRVSTIAGTGEQLRVQVVRGVPRPTSMKLASPWDVWVQGDELFIAMAGTHQIWKQQLDGGPIGPYAGNAAEDILDGPLLPKMPFQEGFAAFAQPSGLASDGSVLFVADSEGSSIRTVPLKAGKNVGTLLGTSKLQSDRLFTYGDRDGPLGQAMLQHPLGLAYANNRLFIADTYNSKVKELDLKTGVVRTLVGDSQAGANGANGPPPLDEPGGVSVAGNYLYIADTNHHAVCVFDLSRGLFRTLALNGLRPPQRSSAKVTPPSPTAKQLTFEAVTLKPVDGEMPIAIELSFPAGFKLNPDAPLRYFVQPGSEPSIVSPAATGKWLTVEKPAAKCELRLPLQVATGGERLAISLSYYYCRSGAEGVCKAGEVTWTGRVALGSVGAERLELKHVAGR